MALQIWLPLIKQNDLTNLGLSNCLISSSSLPYEANGKIGGCASFNGHHIKIENLPSFSDNCISIAFWVKPSNTSQTGCLLNYRKTTGGDLGAFLISGKIRFDAGGAQTTFNYSFTTNWLHIAITYDKSNKKLYVNGVLLQTVACNGNISTTATKGTIGQSSIDTTSGSGNNLVGLLNDYRIYDHCLSIREVLDLAMGLCVHYKFDEAFGNVIPDVSGYNRNAEIVTGTISNNPVGTGTDQTIIRYNKCLVNTSDYPAKAVFDFPQSSGLTVSLRVKLSEWGAQTSGLISTATSNTTTPSDYNTTTFNHRDSTFDLRGTNGTSYRLTLGTGELAVGAWHHIVMTHDGTTAKIYSNGIEKRTLSVPTSLVNFKSLFFGWSQAGGATRKCKGSWSDFRMYATALTADLVVNLYEEASYIDDTGNVGCYQFSEQTSLDNMLSLLNQDVVNNIWTGVLFRYTNPNLTVTSVGDSVRIYRTPNVDGSNYGGFVINNSTNRLGLTKGHTYVIIFDVRGKSCSAIAGIEWVHTVGWNYSDGTRPSPTNVVSCKLINDGNFNDDNWNLVFYKFTLSDDLYKTSAGLSGGHTAGLLYLSYNYFTYLFTYSTTNSVGTDVYLRNFRMFDITNGLDTLDIKSTGEISGSSIIQNGKSAFISSNGEINGNNLIEI